MAIECDGIHEGSVSRAQAAACISALGHRFAVAALRRTSAARREIASSMLEGSDVAIVHATAHALRASQRGREDMLGDDDI